MTTTKTKLENQCTRCEGTGEVWLISLAIPPKGVSEEDWQRPYRARCSECNGTGRSN